MPKMTAAIYRTRQEQRRKAASNQIMYNKECRSTTHGIDKCRWVEHPAAGLRFVGKVHEIKGGERLSDNRPYFDRPLIDHRGWYVDNFQDETVCGEVYQLPSRNGKPVYVPAIEDHCGNGGALINFHDATGDLRDAIRWADRAAERYAEDEREYQAKDAAEQRIGEIKSEIDGAFSDFKRLCKEIRANCDKLTGLTEMRKLIKSEYRRVRSHVRKLRAERKELEADYWTAVPNGY